MCPSFGSCRESHPGAFFEGQLHHIGPHYDLVSASGTALRIVAVGQEYGKGPAQVSIAARTDMILYSGFHRRFRATDGMVARKPHMRGTTSLLRAFFGAQPGHDHAGEWLELVGGRANIFEAFALVNFLLCSAVDADFGTDVRPALLTAQKRGGQRGRASRTMRQNCARHFRGAIETPRPDRVGRSRSRGPSRHGIGHRRCISRSPDTTS